MLDKVKKGVSIGHIKHSYGFTLIELLIVVSIIGILATVIMVSLMSAREKGKMSRFKSQAKAVQTRGISLCASQALDVPSLGGNLAGYVITGVNNSCGPSGNFSFTLTINSTALVSTCTATATERGIITFAGC